MDTESKHLLLEALSRRLKALQNGACYDTPGDTISSPPLSSPEMAEESLRLCMVKYWPRFQCGMATAMELPAYLAALRQIFYAAQTEDLRFLDAWNNAFETLTDRRCVEYPQEHIKLFAECYAQLLSIHIERLNENLGAL